MDNHTHLVVTVTGDPDPGHMLELFKSWATRAVKKVRPLPTSGTFWTAKGSRRKLPDDEALRNGVVYVVCKQSKPLAVWHAPKWLELIDAYRKGAEESETG